MHRVERGVQIVASRSILDMPTLLRSAAGGGQRRKHSLGYRAVAISDRSHSRTQATAGGRDAPSKPPRLPWQDRAAEGDGNGRAAL